MISKLMRASPPSWVAPLVFVIAFIATLGAIPVHWESNDDAGMAMAAHGYGLAAYASPHLVFSSSWEGLIASAVGWPFGLQGYALYQVVCVAAAGAGLAWWLQRLGNGALLTLALLLALFIRPVLFPQFTLTAGLLAASATVGFLVFARDGKRRDAAAALVLALLALMTRFEAALFAFAIASPVVFVGFQPQPRRAIAVAIGLLCCAVALKATEARTMARPEWRQFAQTLAPRAAITDYGVGALVAASPELLKTVSVSENDLAMIRSWWLIDPSIAAPEKLQAIADLAPAQRWRVNLAALAQMPKELMAPDLVGATLLALAAVALARPRRPALAALVLFVALIAGLFILGRHVSRVHYCGLAALTIAIWASARSPPKLQYAMLAAALAVSALSLANFLPRVAQAREKGREGLADLRSLDASHLYYVWGSSLSLEATYPPFMSRADAERLRMFPIGGYSLAPFALAQLGERGTESFFDSFTGREGVRFLAHDVYMPLLAKYCEERFDGALVTLSQRTLSTFSEHHVRCETSSR